MSDYAELHCLSNFSFLRGASHPQELVQRAHELGYRALAITDECSMAGVVRAHEAALALPGNVRLQLIIGAEFRCDAGPRLVLLAPVQQAYAELCRLITRARRRAPKGRYTLTAADLESGLEHCLALWLPPLPGNPDGAGSAGSAGAHTTPDALGPEARGEWLRDRFAGRAWLAVELQRGARDHEQLAAALALATCCGLPAVAAGDVHMHRRSRRRLQDLLTAIRHGCTLEQAGTRLFANGERHLRGRTALARLYPAELLAESLRIAQRCSFSLAQLHYEYPAELVPAGCTASAQLRALTLAGARQRWPAGMPSAVQALLERELALVAELAYEHFFLTVHELVSWARARGILCQGRGSAANSAVCYALGITEVDPGRTQLLFERFISRERREPPDIDVDFEHERREEVIQHIYDKYGREHTALAATVITYRSRSARRDVERAFGIVAGQPADARRVALAEAMIGELRGFPRHLSQHVGGFVISGQPLHELVPVENAAMADRTVIQWDKDDLETLGLLKVDVLALGMLTAIRKTLELLRRHRGWPACVQDIPAEDQATYEMICRGETIGVFQIESRAQMSMLPRLQPRCFYDLVIEVAIVRPGPIQGGMVHPYLQRRVHPQLVEYPSEALKGVLGRTLGVPIFQEQVMQIAVVAANFTPGEADQLRRAMAAWKRRGGLEPFRERLLAGMAANGYTSVFAERVYKQILGFGEYGFPESHAASFALLTYVSCWLKRHEPAAFFAALVNCQPMGFYQPAQLLAEARRSGVRVLPPCVLKSDWDCTLEHVAGEALALRIGLRQVRALRADEAARIVAARADTVSGPPADIAQLAQRAALATGTLQRLAEAGALQSLSVHRHAASWQALGAEPPPGPLPLMTADEAPAPIPAPSEAQEILADYRQLALSTTRHPLALLRAGLRAARIRTGLELRGLPDGSRVRACGLITHLQRPGTAAGVVFLSLEDETGIVNVIIWPQVYEAQREVALGASLLVVSGTLQNRAGVVHVVARRLHDRSHWLGGLTRRSRDFH